MINDKFTAAPWELAEDKMVILGANRTQVVSDYAPRDTENRFIPDYTTRKNNARLIASAPQLLAALRFCRSVIEKNGMLDMSEGIAYDMACDAITTACGE